MTHNRADYRHGADRIPYDELEQVKQLLAAGNLAAAGVLLGTLSERYGLKSYEAHHLAQHLLAQVRNKLEVSSESDSQSSEICRGDPQGPGPTVQ